MSEYVYKVSGYEKITSWDCVTKARCELEKERITYHHALQWQLSVDFEL